MEIKIIGAQAANPIESDKIKKHASALFYSSQKCLQIDVGNHLEDKVDYLLISHIHFDHMGQIHTVPPQTNIFVPAKNFQERLSTKTSAPINYFPQKQELKLDNFLITAFQVHHSQNTKAFGFHIEAEGKKIAWLSDYRYLRGCLKYFENLDILFIGASAFVRPIYSKGGKKYGHMAISNTLNILRYKNIKPKKIYLIHLGKQLTPIPEKIKILKEKFPDFDLDVAFDNQKIFL